MLIEEQEIEVRWSPKTKKHYEERGYIFTKYKDTFIVKLRDLPTGSDYKISYICDYCKEKSFRKYESYNRIKEKSVSKKDSCSKKECVNKKIKEQNLIKYGVEHHMELKDVRDKIARTNIQRYGVKNVFESQYFQDKATNTVRDKYGVDNIFQSNEFKKLCKDSNLIKYGVEHHMSLPEFQIKARNTRINNFGRYYTKASNTFVNGVACSRKQLELGEFLNGEINKEINGNVIDIYLEKLNLAIEYDGKGHNLSVVFGQITQDEFDKKEIIRNKSIINKGMTLLRVVNMSDKKFKNEIVLDFINDKLVTNELNTLVIS